MIMTSNVGTQWELQNTILRVVQRDSFGDEISCLRLGKPFPRISRLSKITPFLDDEGILRS